MKGAILATLACVAVACAHARPRAGLSDDELATLRGRLQLLASVATTARTCDGLARDFQLLGRDLQTIDTLADLQRSGRRPSARQLDELEPAMLSLVVNASRCGKPALPRTFPDEYFQLSVSLLRTLATIGWSDVGRCKLMTDDLSGFTGRHTVELDQLRALAKAGVHGAPRPGRSSRSRIG